MLNESLNTSKKNLCACFESCLFTFWMYSIPGVEMAPSGSWTSAPKEAFIVGLKELPESDDPVTHRHIFYAHAYKVGLWTGDCFWVTHKST